MNIIFKIIICLLLNILTSRPKNGVYLCSAKHLKVLLKTQWISVILLSLFVIRLFRGTCSCFDIIKRHMVRESLGTPDLDVAMNRVVNESGSMIVCLCNTELNSNVLLLDKRIRVFLFGKKDMLLFKIRFFILSEFSMLLMVVTHTLYDLTGVQVYF